MRARQSGRFAVFAVLMLLGVMTALVRQSASQSVERGQRVNLRLPDGQQVELYDQSYALVIGVSRYADKPLYDTASRPPANHRRTTATP